MKKIRRDKALLIIFLFLPLIFGMSAPKNEPQAKQNDLPVKIRDPFKSPFEAQPKQVRQSPSSPILNYNLSALKLVGIVWGKLGKAAVVETPDGKCYLIKKNTVIGKSRGIVKGISHHSLDIQTTVTDYLGRARTEDITIKLYQEEKK